MVRSQARFIPSWVRIQALSLPLSLVGLAVVVVAAGVVRVWALGAVGFNSDEAVYAGQAAALAGNPEYAKFFAIFRAHPLLVQFALSIPFHFGVSDLAARYVSVGFGVAAIPLIYLIGSYLFSRRVGLLAAGVLALLPYHVIVTRQVLLDGPETTLFLLTMYLLALFAGTGQVRYWYGAAFAAGMTFLAKETAILVLGVVVAFVLMTPVVRITLRRALLGIVVFAIAVAPYPISIAISGASDTARSFLLWQLLRRPNHTVTFYAEILPSALGWVLLVLALLGLILAVRRASWQDRLLLSWVFVPLIFFQAWPVKGFQYLLPAAPAFILLACRFVTELPPTRWPLWQRGLARLHVPDRVARFALTAALVPLLLVSVATPTLAGLNSGAALGSLAGTGGLPGGREAGAWINRNVPINASFMTIGPTLSNIIQFYGHRRSLGLSVSPNPLRRNPAYEPIENPDHMIRSLQIQYVAYDVWSAARSSFFARTLIGYVVKYHGTLVYEQTAVTRDADGREREQVVISIYAVRP